ncbi:MAG: CPBP family intramembrane metalloprotease [Bacilli bacterium]|nr:CPBP family intramembrane metalloprotease [Bacilli bacterium]
MTFERDTKENLKYLLPIRSIMFIIIFVVGSYITKKSLNDITNWWSIVATIVNVITILVLLFVAKRIGSSYKELINYEKGKTKIKEVIIITLIVLVFASIGMNVAGLICYKVIPYMAPMMAAPVPLILAIINFILLPLTVAFAEDGLYLGCGVNSFKNKYLAILVPAFFYALQHSFIPVLFDFKYIIYRFLCFLPLTIIFCIYYYKKKNPVPIMIGHAIVEIASVVLILVTSISPELYQSWL